MRTFLFCKGRRPDVAALSAGRCGAGTLWGEEGAQSFWVLKAFPSEVAFEKGLKEVRELVLWICEGESS